MIVTNDESRIPDENKDEPITYFTKPRIRVSLRIEPFVKTLHYIFNDTYIGCSCQFEGDNYMYKSSDLKTFIKNGYKI